MKLANRTIVLAVACVFQLPPCLQHSVLHGQLLPIQLVTNKLPEIVAISHHT